MAAQQGTKEYNNFVKGLITEASPLTFPEDSSLDEVNFELNRDGSRHRRFGMDYELSYSNISTSLSDTVMSACSVAEYHWDNVANDPDQHVAVVQTHEKLWFFDADVDSISGAPLNGGSSLDIAGVGNDPIQFSAINGVLVCTNKNLDPFYVSYNSTTDTFSSTSIDVKTRDFWGVDDTYDIDERPASLTDEHNYNLLNQGWLAANITTFKADPGSVHPSNADVVYLGKDTDDVFVAALLKKQYFGTGPAPKGKFIIDAFTRGASRETLSGVSNLPVDSEGARPKCSSVYAGRVFYAGMDSSVTTSDSRSPNYGGMIFFTQIITSNDDLGKCYQDADPTSEHVPDIIDTDGGFIVIPEASNILRLESTSDALVVFAENGIWEIYGDTGGFIATSYQVSKVTNVGVLGPGNIVNAEGSLLYWSRGGIYATAQDDASGRLTASNVTENTVQTLYNSIGENAKKFAKGIFDPASRKISWYYNGDSSFDGLTYRYKTNRALVIDTVLRAFSKYTIKELSSDSPYIAGAITTHSFTNATFSRTIVADSVAVAVNGDPLIATTVAEDRGSNATKAIVLTPHATDYKLTFGNYNNSTFLDWFQADAVGVDAAGYLDTGLELFGDTQREKQVPYILFHFTRTETGFDASGDSLTPLSPSGCLVQARWDFSDSSNSGKWGTAFQAYRLQRPYQPTGPEDAFDYGQNVITTKSKLRGRGKALSLHIYTEAGKDLRLLGWGTTHNVGTKV